MEWVNIIALLPATLPATFVGKFRYAPPSPPKKYRQKFPLPLSFSHFPNLYLLFIKPVNLFPPIKYFRLLTTAPLPCCNYLTEGGGGEEITMRERKSGNMSFKNNMLRCEVK